MTREEKIFISRCVNKGKLSCELNKCKCDCGGYAKEGYDFILGHHMRLKKYKDMNKCWKLGNEPWNKDLKGIHLSPESEWKPGNEPWNKDLTGDEYKKHYPNGIQSCFEKGQNISPDTQWKPGKYHPMWNGSDGWYHQEARKLFGLSSCEHCGMTQIESVKQFGRRLDMHNTLLPKNYTILERYAWQSLCLPCHIRLEKNES